VKKIKDYSIIVVRHLQKNNKPASGLFCARRQHHGAAITTTLT